jgi:hypothetical protein
MREKKERIKIKTKNSYENENWVNAQQREKAISPDLWEPIPPPFIIHWINFFGLFVRDEMHAWVVEPFCESKLWLWASKTSFDWYLKIEEHAIIISFGN